MSETKNVKESRLSRPQYCENRLWAYCTNRLAGYYPLFTLTPGGDVSATYFGSATVTSWDDLFALIRWDLLLTRTMGLSVPGG